MPVTKHTMTSEVSSDTSPRCELFNTFLQGPDKANAVEIASAITIEVQPILKELCVPNTTLYIPAMPNKLGDGDVASNFRYKHDKDINNDVVKKWMEVLTLNSKQKNPLVVTTVSRSQRYLTLNMPDNGSIKIMNNLTNEEIPDLTQKFANFLTVFDIESEKMKVIRKASEGARFNSYLSDMIGFMNMVNWANGNVTMFTMEHLEAHVETEGEVYHRAEYEGQLIIKPVSVNGREWKPKKGFQYMYFRPFSGKMTPTQQKFYILKDGQMTRVYSQIFKAISMDENDTKKMVREFMVSHNYYRLSDYWVNDVDDAFTLMMILNCFDDDDIDLTEEEKVVKESLEVVYEGIMN